MKITATTNLTNAIVNQDGIMDRHLPIYIRNYNVTIPIQYQSKTNVIWSTVGFVPSFEELKRILNIRLAISVIAPLGPYHSSISDLSIFFDFSEINDFLKNVFLITIEGPIEGNISFDVQSSTLNATDYIDYDYEIENARLTLHIRNLTFEITTFPMTMYMNINIRDDIDDNNYPRLLPLQVANNILSMPALDVSNDGTGVTIVTLLLFCCPEELKTLQLSTVDISLPGAFNPTFDITNLLTTQGIPIPIGGFNFRFEPARAFPSVEVDPIDWTQSPTMVSTNYDLQNLYTNTPNVSVIILYDDYSTINIEQPSYMSWLNSHVNDYDIVLLTGHVVKQSDWTSPSFQNTENFYNGILTTIGNLKKPVITICDENGTDEPIQSPNGTYNFVAANTYPLTLGGIQLNDRNSYLLNGPYKADSDSGGGYSNVVFKPSYQVEYVVSSFYARPDLSGYSRDLIFSLNGGPSSSYGIGYTIQPLASLFSKIYVNSLKKDWDFKFIIYRKGPSICTSIFQGRNQKYECLRFEHCPWNPIVGFGNLNCSRLYDMCNVIRNNTLVQISSIDLPNPLSFINTLPNNPFANIISPQPVFGFSSIFSFFKIYSSGTVFPSPQPPPQSPILTGSSVYLLDMTERFALAYGVDDVGKLYVFIQEANYSSNFQQWRLVDPMNPSVIRPLFAFDRIIISPLNYSTRYISGKWNANGSLKPSCPSISTTSTSSEQFVMNTDASVDAFVEQIKNDQLNDLIWSYYTNFTYYNSEPSARILLYLRNSNLLSLNGDPTTIYNARNEAQEFDRTPRWGAFDPYPEWILIPLNVDYDPMMYIGDVDDTNSTTGTYLIFNTVTLSYLFFGFGKILEKPISIDTFATDPVYEFHINQFIFNVSTFVETNNKVFPEDLFSPTNPPKLGLPNNVEYEPAIRENVVVTHVETNPDGYFQRCAWKNPVGNTVGEELRDGLYNGEQSGFNFTFYWVAKLYIVENETEDIRLIAYNGVEEDDQENNGFAISSDRDVNNLENNTPSMVANVNLPSTRWRLTNNTRVKDSSMNIFYIVYDENLKHASQTNLRMIAIHDPQLRAIGVNSDDVPQPTLVDRTVPVISEWSVTTTSFPEPPNQRQRSNYLYKGIVYSFYSYSDELTAGFLSSQRDFIDEQNVGWEPSMIEGYIDGGWVYVGDILNCFFLIT